MGGRVILMKKSESIAQSLKGKLITEVKYFNDLCELYFDDGSLVTIWVGDCDETGRLCGGVLEFVRGR